MGTFNTILATCPNPRCGVSIGFETKSGSCCLYEYDLDDAPDADMFDVNRHSPATCDNCGQTDIWVAYDILENRAKNRRVVIGKPEITIIDAKLDVCPDCGAEFQIVYGTIKMGDVLFEIEIEYCPECGFIKNTTAKRKD